jgi:hypothetical protein
VQDEAELSLFPTLTRMWMLRGQQRKIRAPGVRPPKRHECAATDWRTGEIVRIRFFCPCQLKTSPLVHRKQAHLGQVDNKVFIENRPI